MAIVWLVTTVHKDRLGSPFNRSGSAADTTEPAGQARIRPRHADSRGRALTCAAPVTWRPPKIVMRERMLAARAGSSGRAGMRSAKNGTGAAEPRRTSAADGNLTVLRAVRTGWRWSRRRPARRAGRPAPAGRTASEPPPPRCAHPPRHSSGSASAANAGLRDRPTAPAGRRPGRRRRPGTGGWSARHRRRRRWGRAPGRRGGARPGRAGRPPRACRTASRCDRCVRLASRGRRPRGDVPGDVFGVPAGPLDHRR